MGNHALMKLDDFLKAQSITAKQFADRLGVEKASVHRYIAGDRIPSRDVMLKIAEATNGDVTANDFYSIQ